MAAAEDPANEPDNITVIVGEVQGFVRTVYRARADEVRRLAVRVVGLYTGAVAMPDISPDDAGEEHPVPIQEARFVGSLQATEEGLQLLNQLAAAGHGEGIALTPANVPRSLAAKVRTFWLAFQTPWAAVEKAPRAGDRAIAASANRALRAVIYLHWSRMSGAQFRRAVGVPRACLRRLVETLRLELAPKLGANCNAFEPEQAVRAALVFLRMGEPCICQASCTARGA